MSGRITFGLFAAPLFCATVVLDCPSLAIHNYSHHSLHFIEADNSYPCHTSDIFLQKGSASKHKKDAQVLLTQEQAHMIRMHTNNKVTSEEENKRKIKIKLKTKPRGQTQSQEQMRPSTKTSEGASSSVLHLSIWPEKP